jgi:hypothetical protein
MNTDSKFWCVEVKHADGEFRPLWVGGDFETARIWFARLEQRRPQPEARIVSSSGIVIESLRAKDVQ